MHHCVFLEGGREVVLVHTALIPVAAALGIAAGGIHIKAQKQGMLLLLLLLSGGALTLSSMALCEI